MRVISFGFRGIENVEGGFERHAEKLYPELAKLGCHIEVLARSPYTENKQPHDVNGVLVTSLWSPPGKGTEAFFHSLLALFYAALKRPDLVHIHGVGPALMAPLGRALGLRIIVTHHGQEYDATKWGLFARTVLKIGEWSGMTFAHQRIVVSRQLRDSVFRKFGRHAVIIPNGVIVEAPTADDAVLSDLRLTKNRYLIEVARLTEHKGQDRLIRAFADAGLQDWKLVLIGGNTASDYYCKGVVEMAAKTPNVVLAGFRTGHELRQLYSHAGMFSLPSSYEGMPIAALEALGFGLPVILSDIPAHLELGLPPEYYFPTGDVEELTKRIKTMAQVADSPKIRALMKSVVDSRPDWPAVAEQTLAIYRTALGRSNPAIGREPKANSED